MANRLDADGEHARLAAVTGSYGGGAAPFDAAMRVFMMRTFEPFFREGPCLQVGCAHGDQTSLLVDRFDDVTVIEPAAEFLAHAKARIGSRAVFVEALVETFETDRRFETIIFSHVLEHVADPVDVLRRLGELLTPTGRLFIIVPNAEAPSRRIAVKMGALQHLQALSPDDLAAGHRRVYRLDTLCRDVRVAGLPVTHTGGIFFKPLANFQLNALIGGPLMGEAFLEGCYELGREDAASCASIYVIAERPA
jgi:2-polyprenyl-3-methyl-5-hydroxy-6-metoxy-1,4-benzoquinol methylase